jgi:hypothetical protein
MATKKPAKKTKGAISSAEASVESPPADAAVAPATPAATKTTKAKASKAPKPEKRKKLSALDAAAKVLADAGEPMNCSDMVEAMTKKGLWTSPNGLTPAATLYSAILRELKTKDAEARFVKTERGKFAAKA